MPVDQKELELEFAARFSELLTARGSETTVVGSGEEPADVLLASGGDRINLQIGEAFDEHRRRRNRIKVQVLEELWTQENASRYSGMSFCFVECGADTSLPKLTPNRLRVIKASLLAAIEEGFLRTAWLPGDADLQRGVEIELAGPFRVSVIYSRYATESMQLPPRFMWVLGGVIGDDESDVFVPIIRKKISKYGKIATPFWLLIYALENHLSRKAVREITEAIEDTPSMPFDRVYVVCNGTELTQVFPLGAVDHLSENAGVSMFAADCLPVFNDDRWRDAKTFQPRAIVRNGWSFLSRG